MQKLTSTSLRAYPLTLYALTVLFMLLTPNLIGATWQATATSSQDDERRDVVQLFRKYSDLEEKGAYADIYELLSDRFKRKLRTESGVKTASDYNRLRLGSEAQWSEIRLVRINKQQPGLKIIATARVEESGAVEKIESTYYLVNENGKWKIDRWEY